MKQREVVNLVVLFLEVEDSEFGQKGRDFDKKHLAVLRKQGLERGEQQNLIRNFKESEQQAHHEHQIKHLHFS